MPEQDEKSQIQEKKTILVVEDDERWQEMISRCLTREGYVVKTASDPKGAFEAWEKGKPDLVLTDLSMDIRDGSDEGGMELIDQIRKHDPLMPIIIITAFPTIERMRRAFGSFRVDDFFLKGEWSCEELRQKVREALDCTGLERAKAVITRLDKENAALRDEIDDLRRGKEQHEEDLAASTTTSNELEVYQSFTQAVVHDLGNELGLLPTNIRRITRNPGLPVEVEEELEVMMRRLRYSLILNQRLKSISMLEFYASEPIPVARIVESIKSMAGPRVPSSVALSVEVEPSVEKRTVETDEWQVPGVVLELINNASRVLSKEGGSIEVIVKGEDDNLVLSVKDDGPGIPEELHDVILKEPVPSERGKGLGLYFSRKVIEALGGTLYLESTSSEGTVFSISLPVSNTQEED